MPRPGITPAIMTLDSWAMIAARNPNASTAALTASTAPRCDNESLETCSAMVFIFPAVCPARASPILVPSARAKRPPCGGGRDKTSSGAQGQADGATDSGVLQDRRHAEAGVAVHRSVGAVDAAAHGADDSRDD